MATCTVEARWLCGAESVHVPQNACRARLTPHNWGFHISRLMLSATLIDEVGYLSYNNRHADLLFHIVSRRHQQRSTIVTTNRPFSEWHQTFPGAACVAGLIDRLVQNAEIIAIEGDSRRKEAEERQHRRRTPRRKTRPAETP